jgi:hypothetical protein
MKYCIHMLYNEKIIKFSKMEIKKLNYFDSYQLILIKMEIDFGKNITNIRVEISLSEYIPIMYFR